MIALTALLLAAGQPAPLDSLRWLAGTWAAEDGERWTEEHWSAPRGGVMLGYSRTGQGLAVRQWEFVRLAPGPGGATAYHASPEGRPAVAFPLVSVGAGTATFENRSHDYPQRIVYRRAGDTLIATISAADGSNARSWTYRRATR